MDGIYRCWGKARPDEQGGPQYHLLSYHCLDVAATGRVLLQRQPLMFPARAGMNRANQDQGRLRKLTLTLFVVAAQLTPRRGFVIIKRSPFAGDRG